MKKLIYHLKVISDRLTQLGALPNNQAGFQWKVFSVGRTRKIQVKCQMDIKRISIELTTSISESTTPKSATTTSALTTVQTTTETTTEEPTTTKSMTTALTTTLATTKATTQEKINFGYVILF